MKILVLNCGSSSIKYQLLEMSGEPDVLAMGMLERIGLGDSKLSHEPKGKDKYKSVQDISDHTAGVELILRMLVDKEHGVLKDVHEITAVGHRVVHGGETFKESVLITQEVIDKMEEVAELAPLHNPANLKGIYSMQKILPNVPQCATFDTAFHQSMPDYAYMYGLPFSLYEKHKIRRYGFHGTSHKYVSHKAAEFLGKPFDSLRMITCHLGNGASVAAIKYGKVVDTSMGLTPVEGLMMGTRAGDLDIGALFFLMDKENLNPQQASDLVNKKSGVLGISGVSSDMRDVEIEAWTKGHKRAELALNMYFYRVKKYIGAYAAAMGGVDVIIFTGGIGERGPETRELICEGLEYMGVLFNKEINEGLKVKKPVVISKETSKVTVMAIPTNEELVIAQETLSVVSKKKFWVNM